MTMTDEKICQSVLEMSFTLTVLRRQESFIQNHVFVF